MASVSSPYPTGQSLSEVISKRQEHWASPPHSMEF